MNSSTNKRISIVAAESSESGSGSASENSVVSGLYDGRPRNELDMRDDYEHAYFIPRKPVPRTAVSNLYKNAGPPKKSESTGDAIQLPVKRRKPNSFRTWWLEIVSCILSVTAFVAIIATLWSYNDKPLPDWPYHLTLNALLSIYVVILKAALLLVTSQGIGQLKWRWFDTQRPLSHISTFDEATRGPWGSIELLWMLKWRNLIASTGALVALAVLLVEPFTQQVISLYQCIVPVHDPNATISRINHFADFSNATSLRAAIERGVFNPGLQATFHCPTGNCDFAEVYHSVGYCGSCNDTTDEVAITTKPDLVSHFSYANISFPGNESPSGRWRPPETVFLTDNWNGSNLVYFLANYSTGNFVASATNQEYSCSPNKSLTWGCSRSLCKPPYDDLSCWNYGAAHCTIQPCVKAYRSTVKAGVLSETVSASYVRIWNQIYYPDSSPDFPWATVNKACLPQQTQNQVSGLQSTIEHNGWLSNPNLMSHLYDDQDFPTRDYWIPDPHIHAIRVPVECVYVIERSTNDLIQRFLEDYLGGEVSRSAPGQLAGPAQILAIYNEGNISFHDLNEFFVNISYSLTHYIRQNGDPNSNSPALGTMNDTQTCVHVRWAWLAYAVVLVTLTLLFLIATIVETHGGERNGCDWKSEPLALLFHGLDDGAYSRIASEELIQTRDMHRAAEGINVRLRKKGDRWMFATTS